MVRLYGLGKMYRAGHARIADYRGWREGQIGKSDTTPTTGTTRRSFVWRCAAAEATDAAGVNSVCSAAASESQKALPEFGCAPN